MIVNNTSVTISQSETGLAPGATGNFRYIFRDANGKDIPPPQQMTFTTQDQNLTIGSPTALDTVPITAGPDTKLQCGPVLVNAPGIVNGTGSFTIDVGTMPIASSSLAMQV